MPLIRRIVQFTAAGGILTLAGWEFYTYKSHFVPFSLPLEQSSAPSTLSTLFPSQLKRNPEFPLSAYKQLNPSANKPKLIDNCERRVRLSELKTEDRAELTTEFCRGVWSGWGFWYQRRYLEKKWRSLEGREGMIWSGDQMRKSDYPVGTMIADHFVVLERDEGKVVIRCGDSPLNEGKRPDDGIFSIEVDIDEDKKEAVFHLKSLFFDSTPAGNEPGGALPWWVDQAHKEYTKLLMETSVRKLVKY